MTIAPSRLCWTKERPASFTLVAPQGERYLVQYKTAKSKKAIKVSSPCPPWHFARDCHLGLRLRSSLVEGGAGED